MKINASTFQPRSARITLPAFWLSVAILATGQDALFAFLKDTSFYWSESLLYKIYWLLFIPLTVFISLVARRFPVKHLLLRNLLIHALLAILTSLFQILLFSALIAILSEVILGYPFYFQGVLRKSLSEDFFTGILMYSLLILLANRFTEKRINRLPSAGVVSGADKNGKTTHLSIFLVKDGARTLRLATEKIDWIGSEDSYTVLHSAEGKWLYPESLTKLTEQLDLEKFLRIHRSCIVNIHRVKKVTSRLTGDYDVQLDDGTVLRMSRHYARKAKGVLI
ncbi:LytR/AlgR family response regulator transcription factor [Persicitalea jodogahamensis]|uniref:HTH LytTR-type domain-containing protein n=1 Tax=Persicitalea jodogahamensis TaxID=402147 RepID=A0A8J3D1K1_9BACT|nr:LytTR family DNA-binding domain-containing protein [Persicitalea jodogahamensis]GHB64346.1 hypothetical protein GCM10007390_17790 [Persicitalea jodogahamensis]